VTVSDPTVPLGSVPLDPTLQHDVGPRLNT